MKLIHSSNTFVTEVRRIHADRRDISLADSTGIALPDAAGDVNVGDAIEVWVDRGNRVRRVDVEGKTVLTR